MNNSANPMEIYGNLINSLTFGAIIRDVLGEDQRLKAISSDFQLKNLTQWATANPGSGKILTVFDTFSYKR
jgi:hypothetical protein